MHIRSDQDGSISRQSVIYGLENREDRVLDLQKGCAHYASKSRGCYLPQMSEKVFSVAFKGLL